MWCGKYAGWCMAMASIPREIVEQKYTTDPYYTWNETVYSGSGDYELKKGDVVLFRYGTYGNEAESPDTHIVLIESVETTDDTVIMHTINGNHHNNVSYDDYEFSKSTGQDDDDGWVCEIYSPDFNKDITTYDVTFDPTGGEVSRTSKKLGYRAFYGVLPTPVRSLP